MAIESLAVPLDKLTTNCDPDTLGFETTEELDPLQGTVGQNRAINALEFGLNIDAPGYNIYLAGFPGTGRTTTLTHFLRQIAEYRRVPPDYCYVHNFQDPQQPIAIAVKAGMGRELVQNMKDLLHECLNKIPAAFEGPDYHAQIAADTQRIDEQRQAVSNQIAEKASELGFITQPSPTGINTVPVVNGQPISQEQFNQLPNEHKNQVRENNEKLQSFINERLQTARILERDELRIKREVDKTIVLNATGPAFAELKELYSKLPDLVEYFNNVQLDMAQHPEEFRLPEEEREQQVRQQYPTESKSVLETILSNKFIRYQVNLLVDNSMIEGAPVIFEYSPTFYNIFGRIEHHPRFGNSPTDLTMLTAGAIHRANGGYLVLQAKDVLSNSSVWDTLKRVLRNTEARIENIPEQYNPVPTSTLRPQPIPIATKIVLMGTPSLFNVLQDSDEDFRKFFKVKADFDTSMERTLTNSRFFGAFVCSQSRDVNIKPFHKSAVASLIEYASRLVEDQSRLTTRFIDIGDIITEADYWSRQGADSDYVRKEHVIKAIEQKGYRSDLPREALQRFMDDGTIQIDTTGSVIGQVNGLSVLNLGDCTFGRPMRITARTWLGQGHVSNIDREAEMTGRIHNKGFLILTSYLMGKYGQDQALNIQATIGFEQTYNEVEGDSAAAAELYAMMSSLAEIPIRQGLAVTGSVNQFGQIQAIGGATHKIEGFFDVCKVKGLSGDQGVVIPKSNINNLVLKEEIVQAIKAGTFQVYAVETLNQGLEILTGMPAGEPDGNGEYQNGTINYAITKKLERFSLKAQQLARKGQWQSKTNL